jgi:hypothetical protein
VGQGRERVICPAVRGFVRCVVVVVGRHGRGCEVAEQQPLLRRVEMRVAEIVYGCMRRRTDREVVEGVSERAIVVGRVHRGMVVGVANAGSREACFRSPNRCRRRGKAMSEMGFLLPRDRTCNSSSAYLFATIGTGQA